MALLWVHATLVETALIVHDLVLPPLSREERARYYAECRVFAGLFGIPQAILPASWEDFTAYNAAMWDSETLTVTAEARMIADQLWRGSNIFLRAPKWYRAVTAKMPPQRLRFVGPYQEAVARLSGARPDLLNQWTNQFWIGRPALDDIGRDNSSDGV